MNLWVYKVRNDPDTEFNARGDWSTVFEKPWREQAWGGAWATRRPDDKRIFDDEVQPGDLILAWQTDRSAAIGLCEVAGRRRGRKGQNLVLRAIEEFPRPVRLHELKRDSHPELQRVQALKQGHVRTIYPTSSDEARMLLAACGANHQLPATKGTPAGQSPTPRPSTDPAV